MFQDGEMDIQRMKCKDAEADKPTGQNGRQL